jgi:CBS domain-containing protein
MLGTTVRDVMTREVVSVREFTSYKQLVEILLEHGVSAVPVVDDGLHVQGVVSEADLIEKEARDARDESEQRHPVSRAARTARSKARAATAGTLMTGPAITIRPDAPLSVAALRMSRHNIKRLPVVDAFGLLLGIVSRSDLLKPYLRRDADIRDEVLARVLAGEMCVDPHSISVDVREGVVTLAGRMESEPVARETAAMVRAVDGVVDVIDRLHAYPRFDAAERPPFRSPAH